jgi:BirA family biotin operon repressor/biotin-[acetyl-CoA-carboxylase] ligase
MKDMLGPDEIKANLGTGRIGSEVVVYASTASTNDVAWHYATSRANDGLVILADEQTAGRGRGANTWLAEKGQSVLCSILLMNEPLEAELLTLASAVAVAEAIGTCGKKQARIKWPNDILIGQKKIAGILLESRALRGRACYVLGFGINCHQESFLAELCAVATSIDMETGACCGRIPLIKRMLVSIENWLKTAAAEPMAVIEKWQELNTQLHQRITLRHNKRTYSGNVLGIDPRRGLIVQLENGGVRMFEAAQTNMVR